MAEIKMARWRLRYLGKFIQRLRSTPRNLDLIWGLRKTNLDLKRIDCVCVSNNKSKSRTRPFNVPDFSLSFFMSSTALRRTSLSPSWTSSCRNNLVGMETRIISCNMPNTEVRVWNWKMKIVKIFVNRDAFLYNDHISVFLIYILID